MSILDNSYGSPDDVAALVTRYTKSGVFDGTPRPTLEQLERYIDRISGITNVYLAEKGFTIPVTQTDAKLALDELVTQAVVELCQVANSAGRFFTDRRLKKQNPLRVIREEIATWIELHDTGLENLGVTRGTGLAGQIAYRDTDDSGDATAPIFQREAFGNAFKNWDS